MSKALRIQQEKILLWMVTEKHFSMMRSLLPLDPGGDIRNGAYDGVWTGYEAKQKLTYQETYAAGKFISGESKDEQNKIYKYTKIRVLPAYKGGNSAFYKFLSKNISYPKSMAAERISG